MKLKITNLVILLLVFSSCKGKEKQEIQSVTNGAKIEVHVSGYEKTINIYGPTGIFEIIPDANGNFSRDIAKNEMGTYTFVFGIENRFSVYVKENTNLKLDIDYKKILNREKNAISVSGQNIEETKLLLALYETKPINTYSRIGYEGEYLPMVFTKTPENFESHQLQELKKTKELITAFKENHRDLDPEFLKVLNLETLLEYNTKFNLYEKYHTLFAPDAMVKIPENFKDYFVKDIPQNDFDLYAKSISYASYMNGLYYAKLSKQLKEYPRESLAYFKAEIQFLGNSNFPKIIKEKMYQGLIISYMRAKDPEIKAWLNKTIAEKVTDETALKRYEDFKAKEVAYNDGDMAPNFTYPDINGKSVSLRDFKGSVVYIDLWATWCGPCIKGLPYFKKLKEKYKNENIKFVMISFDEDIEAWNKMVTGNNEGLFEGIQLATGSYQNEINTTYNVNGIPHYILIDKEGKIVQKSAVGPYDLELIPILDDLLKKQ